MDIAIELNAGDSHGHDIRRLPPGTVHLVDIDQKLRTKHGSGREKHIVLVPAPSADPDDPLNWSRRRKLLLTITLNTYAAIIAMGTAVTYATIVPMSKATELSVNDLNTGTGYLFLLGGWGSLIWQPLALQYGKRPAYLLSLLATTAVMIWAPYTKTNGQWIANKIVQGFFSAPVNSLAEISVADVYFTHERGRYLALFTMHIIGGVYIWPILSGFINDGQGWRWVLFWMGIFTGVTFVFCFLFMEETNYHRRSTDGTGLSGTAAQGSSSSLPSNQSPGLAIAAADEKTSRTSDQAHTTKKTKTFWHKLRLFDTAAFQRPNHLKGMFLRPLIFLSFPVIFYAGFSWGSAVVWHAVFNATASLVLSNPPYNFRASMVGLSFVSGLIGVAIGSLYTGKVGDWFVIYKARRNGGFMEPEHRQWLFLASVLLLPGSLILWVRMECKSVLSAKTFTLSRFVSISVSSMSNLACYFPLITTPSIPPPVFSSPCKAILTYLFPLGRRRLPPHPLAGPGNRRVPPIRHQHDRHAALHRLRDRQLPRARRRGHGLRRPDPQHHGLRHRLRRHAVGDRHGLPERLRAGGLRGAGAGACVSCVREVGEGDEGEESEEV